MTEYLKMMKIFQFNKLKEIFEKQTEFMVILRDAGKLPSWPLDLKSKSGQMSIKHIIHEMQGEIFEAMYTLKNKVHRVSDDQQFDRDHYVEEFADAFAYFVEACIMSGITWKELYTVYMNKISIVQKRFEDGY